jgi:RPA family protein
MRARHTAYLARIGELLGGEYTQGKEDAPSEVFLPARKLRAVRVNLIGYAISEEQAPGYWEIVVDDGSGKIPVRDFDSASKLCKPGIGKLVNVIGRVREYRGQIYILPEIVKQVSDPRMMELRLLELEEARTPESEPFVEEEVVQGGATEHPEQTLVELISELDEGEGVDVQELKRRAGVKNIDAQLKLLTEAGEIFSIAPGKVKAL